jgi:hypothetical protein
MTPCTQTRKESQAMAEAIDGKSMSVFVSYSHRNKRWLQLLQVHLTPLVRKGDIDLWDDTRIRPGADWKAEIERALATAQVAVLLVSPDFLASDFIQDQELPVLLEAAEKCGTRILPVILSHRLYTESPLGRFQAINAPDRPLEPLPTAGRGKALRDLARTIAVRVKDEAVAEPPRVDPCWPEAPPDLIWPMADHCGVREIFATLLTRDSPWRFLPIRGQTETGKSHITKQMLANTLRMPDVACGRFDFKGSIDMDAELRAFVPELGVPLPSSGTSLNERLGQILDDLAGRKRPTLLVFDTYEAAGQPQRDWVEKEPLNRLIRASWLRVVIAGQRVPDSHDPTWGSVAHAAIDLKPPLPVEWFDYGIQYRPDLKLEDVESACRLAKDKAGLLSQLLGPVT